MEKLSALLDTDHKPLKGGGRRKQNIPHKENAIVVMALLIPRLPVLPIHVSSICSVGFSNPLKKIILKFPLRDNHFLVWAFFLLLPCKFMYASIEFTKTIIKEWTFSLGTVIRMIILVEKSYEKFYRNETNCSL